MDIRKLAPGDKILDYRLLERLGEGGFGEVFKAEHELLRRVVAIKVPRDAAGVAALRHEGLVQANLEHPGVVRTIDVSLSHDPPFLVMEHVDGCSLAELLRREKPLPWRKAGRILLEAARALAYAHAKGVVHGDVKPGNILVEPGRDGRVLLTDFGLGRVFEGPQGNLQISRSLELATSGAEVQGTVRYLAPELLRGESVDERADIYSFGVLLFEAVTGRLPEGREVPSELTPRLPAGFDRIFARTFTRRERRPSSLASTIAELEGMLQEGTDGGVAAAAPTWSATPAAATPAASPASPAAPAAEPERPAPELDPQFAAWRGRLLGALRGRMGERMPQVVVQDDVQGFDVSFGVTNEGEPQHRIYTLVVPQLDANSARAIVANARRVFEREKGIWEKEVTFCVLARSVEDRERVLWSFKSFSLGWWRRRRMMLKDLGLNRLYAAELGCDPEGNPLKRGFLAACDEALAATPEQARGVVAPLARRRRVPQGGRWGLAVAMMMSLGVVGFAAGLADRHAIRCMRRARIQRLHQHPSPSLQLLPSTGSGHEGPGLLPAPGEPALPEWLDPGSTVVPDRGAAPELAPAPEPAPELEPAEPEEAPAPPPPAERYF